MSAIALFADVSNLYPAVKAKFNKAKVDYGKILAEIDGVHRQAAYGIQVKEEAVHFITALKHLGYRTNFKHLRKGETWDIQIALDIVRVADKCDCIVVASNSLNLIPVYQWARERGLLVIVLACENVEALAEHVDEVYPLDERYLEVKKNAVQVPVAA